MWTCPNCAAENDDEAPSCAVCATAAVARTAVTRPVGPRLNPASAPVDPRPGPPGAARYEQPADPWARTPIPPAQAAPPPVSAPPFSPAPSLPAPGATTYGYGVPSPPDRPRPPWVLIISLVVIVLAGVVAAALVVPRLLHRNTDVADPAPAPVVTTAPAPDPTTEATTADPAPATEDPAIEDATTAPAAVGVVAIDPAVSDDRASGVARTFDVYYSGINDKDYESVGTVLDPAGSIDPGNTEEMTELADGTRSTRDSDVTLIGLTDSGGGLLAEVRFQSNQDAGDGPRGRTGETCTRWDIVYTLSTASDGTYRIVRSKAHSQPC